MFHVPVDLHNMIIRLVDNR